MPTSIDLFAGCGGLTRGLEWAGFECLAFNELNKDAADSFALNFPDAIRLDGDIKKAVSKKVIQQTLMPLIESKGGLDFLCGGPPCQGYSGIGHRRTHKLEKKDIPTNHLFHEMIRVIKALKPKVFLFENVEGILSGKWTTDGTKGEIFRDVWKGFSSIRGYVAQPTLALSTVPILTRNGLAPRHVDLRPFVLVSPHAIKVTPGGLTRVALKKGSLVVNSSQGGGTKDTWVIGS